jgi:hypothetical protein
MANVDCCTSSADEIVHLPTTTRVVALYGVATRHDDRQPELVSLRLPSQRSPPVSFMNQSIDSAHVKRATAVFTGDRQA